MMIRMTTRQLLEVYLETSKRLKYIHVYCSQSCSTVLGTILKHLRAKPPRVITITVPLIR